MTNVVELPNSVAGKYNAKVVEPLCLPRMRREAYAKAGLYGHYDGSYTACLNLGEFERIRHDEELSKIVEENRDLFEEVESRNTSVLISETGMRKNLILNQGMDTLFVSQSLANVSIACAVGTGTTPTFTDSVAVTATTAGLSTTITASSSFFTAGMVGQLIKFNSGEELYIASQTGTACVVTVAVNIVAPTLFTVWAVNQVGLATETKRSTLYLTGTGNCGNTDVGSTSSMRRTYDFTVEVSNQNYTELGWSHNSGDGNNLFSRTLISGGTVSVLIGQQLRVVYDIVLTFSGTTSTPATWTIGGTTGWPVAPATTTAGNHIRNGFEGPSVSTSGTGFTGTLEPVNPAIIINLGTGSVLPGFGSSYTVGTPAGGTNTASSYTNGNFYRDFTASFSLAQAVGTTWRGVYAGSSNGWTFIFDQAQTKANTHTLSLSIRVSYSRTLTNP